MRPLTLIRGSTVLFVLLAIAAWHSKPVEAHFRQWFARQVTREADGVLERFAGAGMARAVLATADWQYTERL